MVDNKKWADLIKAYGGQILFADIFGCSQSKVHRLAAGKLMPNADERKRIVALAMARRLPSPVAPPKVDDGELEEIDRRILTMLGQTLQQGKKVHPEFSKRYAKTIGEKTLVRVAESDEPEAVLRAATHLLEMGGL